MAVRIAAVLIARIRRAYSPGAAGQVASHLVAATGNRGRSPARRGGFGVFGETEAEISKFMNKTVVTTEEPVFIPEHKFSDFDINEHLKKNIIAKKYELPTPIQDKTIPHALLGQDIVGLAATGTGKTAAFLIPLIDKVMKQKGERILIMAPTRELAVQIEKELAGFAKGLGFRGMVAVGGANIGPQISQLKHNPAFVIGTPDDLRTLWSAARLTSPASARSFSMRRIACSTWDSSTTCAPFSGRCRRNVIRSSFPRRWGEILNGSLVISSRARSSSR